MDRALSAEEADEQLQDLLGGFGEMTFSNGYYHGAKGVDFVFPQMT